MENETPMWERCAAAGYVCATAEPSVSHLLIVLSGMSLRIQHLRVS